MHFAHGGEMVLYDAAAAARAREAAQVAPAVRAQLREALSTTASGVKQRYGIDWGWS